MKIDWKKLLEVKIGNPRPPKVFTPEACFDRMTEAVGRLMGGLIVVMALVPLTAAVLPYFMQPEAEGENAAVFLVLAAFVTPFLLGLLFFVLMVNVYAAQVAVFGPFWKARLPEKWRFLALLVKVPVVRHFMLTPLALRMTEEKIDLHFAPMTAISSGCALIALVFWWIQGILSSNTGFVLMAISLALAVFALKRYLGVPFSRKTRRIAIVAAGLWLVLGGWIWGEADTTFRALARERAVCRGQGMALTAEDAIRHFYGGEKADPEFTALVVRYRDTGEEKSAFEVLAVTVADDLRNPVEKQRELRAFLVSDLAMEYFAAVDRLVAAGRILKYELQPEGLITEWELPHLRFCRTVARGYQWRIIAAAECGDREEAMRLLRLFSQFQENALRGEWISGSLVAVSCESIRLNTIGRLIGLELLSDADLKELQAANQGRERRIRQVAADGMRGDTAMLLDVVDTLAFRPRQILERYASENLTPRQRFIAWKICGDSPLTHWSLAGIRSWVERLQYAMMRYQRGWVEYLSGDGDFSARGRERAALDELYAQRPRDRVSKILFMDWNRYHHAVERLVAQLRMCDLALTMELHRRQYGSFPPLREEVRDPIGGEPFDFIRGRIKLWKTENKQDAFDEFDGWQLHAPGKNPLLPPEERRKAFEDFFNVITERGGI